MERTDVKSSMFKSIGYDPVSWTLEVEFSNGGVYRHKKVPPEVYAALVKAESPGKFFGATIRGKFPYERVKPVEEGEDPDTEEREPDAGT